MHFSNIKYCYIYFNVFINQKCGNHEKSIFIWFLHQFWILLNTSHPILGCMPIVQNQKRKYQYYFYSFNPSLQNNLFLHMGVDTSMGKNNVIPYFLEGFPNTVSLEKNKIMSVKNRNICENSGTIPRKNRGLKLVEFISSFLFGFFFNCLKTI